MISYSRDANKEIPSSSVKILGLGGAGANMLERIALDSIEGAELLALNTDIRTLGASLAKDKIQLGTNLTKGLGTGGDPELGHQAILEAENDVREALKGQQIVFLCTGLGGGTGSGAAPIVARIAREEGAFVVVFATMPFFFEGKRRREQADTALNELAVLSNALVTFDNNRMGDLVLAKQGIHEAFGAADKMISESIKAVIRLVVRPGLINVGLDDLMSALRTNRSRCLFGSGIAKGKDRASKALRNALASPLLDQGSLLNSAQTVLVHLSGGESLTLFEIELLMQNLQKHVPETAHVLFGAAIDPAMGDDLSITLISALPEDALKADSEKFENPFTKTATEELPQKGIVKAEFLSPFSKITESPKEDLEQEAPTTAEEEPEPDEIHQDSEIQEHTSTPITETENEEAWSIEEEQPDPPIQEEEETVPEAVQTETEYEPNSEEERPFAEPELQGLQASKEPLSEEGTTEEMEEDESPNTAVGGPKRRPKNKRLWGKEDSKNTHSEAESSASETADSSDLDEDVASNRKQKTELKLGSKESGSQSELSFDNTPRGRFEGENPNVFEGEDLDLPPFLRKKKS
ncbi:MAG: hypothetical protein AB8D78_13520 [Akkermansiaceae bacterium]